MSKIMDAIERKKHYGGVTLIERMQECHTPGISIVEIENYEISTVYTYGVKRRNTKEKIEANTLFQAASVSKPVFAAAVMRLVENGTLDLDADITEYLIDYSIPAYDNQKYKITLRQILSHWAGLSLHGFPGYRKGQQIPRIDQILRGIHPAHLPKLKVIMEPGTRFMYSGGGYVLAEKIITDVCKRDFNDLMCNLVFSPLSMTHSIYAQPLPDEMIHEIAFGYDFQNLQLPGGYFIMPELSAAGLWTTPSDLALFGIEIMKALNGNSKLLKKDTAEIMTTKVYDGSPTGVGFWVESSKRGLLFSHDGDNRGYHSTIYFCPGDGSGFVIMLNADIGVVIIEEFVNAFKEICGW